MARSKPNSAFVSRSARFKRLKADKEHWHPCDEGIHLGYRRGKTKSTWYVRRYVGSGRYEQKPIALADDYREANGDDVLTFYQAQSRAKERADEATAEERPLPNRRGHTIKDAVDAYLSHYASVSGKQTKEIERVCKRDVLPALGARPLHQLTRAELIGWRNGLIRQKPRSRGGKPIELELAESEKKRRRRATAQRKWTILRAALNNAFASGDVASDSVWRSISR